MAKQKMSVQSIPRDFGNLFPVPTDGRFPGLRMLFPASSFPKLTLQWRPFSLPAASAYSDEIAQAFHLLPFNDVPFLYGGHRHRLLKYTTLGIMPYLLFFVKYQKKEKPHHPAQFLLVLRLFSSGNFHWMHRRGSRRRPRRLHSCRRRRISPVFYPAAACGQSGSPHRPERPG